MFVSDCYEMSISASKHYILSLNNVSEVCFQLSLLSSMFKRSCSSLFALFDWCDQVGFYSLYWEHEVGQRPDSMLNV